MGGGHGTLLREFSQTTPTSTVGRSPLGTRCVPGDNGAYHDRPERSVPNRLGGCRTGRQAGLRTHGHEPAGSPTGRRFPDPVDPVLGDDCRSRIPLRGSPGFSPGSLLPLPTAHKAPGQNQTRSSAYRHRIQRPALSISRTAAHASTEPCLHETGGLRNFVRGEDRKAGDEAPRVASFRGPRGTGDSSARAASGLFARERQRVCARSVPSPRWRPGRSQTRARQLGRRVRRWPTAGARISIYDRVAGALLNDVLYGRADIPAIAVAQLVDERSTSGRSAPLSGFEK